MTLLVLDSAQTLSFICWVQLRLTMWNLNCWKSKNRKFHQSLIHQNSHGTEDKSMWFSQKRGLDVEKTLVLLINLQSDDYSKSLNRLHLVRHTDSYIVTSSDRRTPDSMSVTHGHPPAHYYLGSLESLQGSSLSAPTDTVCLHKYAKCEGQWKPYQHTTETFLWERIKHEHRFVPQLLLLRHTQGSFLPEQRLRPRDSESRL